MAFAYRRPVPAGRAATDLFCRFITYLWDRHRARAAYRRSCDALRDLDTRLLDDVGLTMADRQRLRPGG